jgi:hypothetical protein
VVEDSGGSCDGNIEIRVQRWDLDPIMTISFDHKIKSLSNDAGVDMDATHWKVATQYARSVLILIVGQF